MVGVEESGLTGIHPGSPVVSPNHSFRRTPLTPTYDVG